MCSRIIQSAEPRPATSRGPSGRRRHLDPSGLASSFQYPSSLWQLYCPAITNIVTLYGATAFIIGGLDTGSLTINTGSDNVNRFVQTILPNGAENH
jgi:hypothetical protein